MAADICQRTRGYVDSICPSSLLVSCPSLRLLWLHRVSSLPNNHTNNDNKCWDPHQGSRHCGTQWSTLPPVHSLVPGMGFGVEVESRRGQSDTLVNPVSHKLILSPATLVTTETRCFYRQHLLDIKTGKCFFLLLDLRTISMWTKSSVKEKILNSIVYFSFIRCLYF